VFASNYNEQFGMKNRKGIKLMLCDNCGKNEANIKLTQIINGKKTEMMICEECGHKMGISDINFEMPIDISDFLGDFEFEHDSSEFMPFNTITKEIKCDGCNMTYQEFLDNGKFGCEQCYVTFGEKIDTLLKRIQGTDRYLGRKANKNLNNEVKEVQESQKIENLQKQLKQAIRDERYEDAAKIRDEIKKLSGNQ